MKLAASGFRSKAEDLLEILAEDSLRSPPSFEKLVGDLTGAYSRRINIQHRLVYQVLKDDRIVKILRMWTHYEQPRMSNPVIEVEALVKSYDGTNVVDNVTFDVEEGEIFGIVGPNGAGKTTIVESVEGLRSPDAGSIRVLGLDPSRDRDAVTERLGAQLQETRLQDRIRVDEALDLYASFYRNPADWRPLLDRLGLEGKERSRYSTLSGGQKQRLSIALALIGSPEIAILDELTTGLDPQARRSTWETIEQIRDSGVTVVLVTHFMEEAERLCDRIMVVDRGRSVAIDSASGLIKRVGADQTMRFRPSSSLDDGALRELPEVVEVQRDGAQTVVAGTGNVVQAVSCCLADLGVTMEDLRVDRTTLEEAYLELTGGSAGSAAEVEES